MCIESLPIRSRPVRQRNVQASRRVDVSVSTRSTMRSMERGSMKALTAIVIALLRALGPQLDPSYPRESKGPNIQAHLREIRVDRQ